MTKFQRNVTVICFLSIAFVSCKEKKASASHDNWDKQNLRNLDVKDSAYQNAIKIARDNLNFFIKLFQDKKNNKFDYYIKSRFVEDENVEHMWLVVDSINGDTFIATLDNVPDKLTKLKLNDQLKIPSHNVEDWIIYQKDSVLFGNFISHSLDK